MKKLTYLLTAIFLFCMTPMVFAAGNISLFVECDRSASNAKCDTYEYKTNPDLFEPQNLAFKKDNANGEYYVKDRISHLPHSKGITRSENCGFIVTGNETIACPLEDDIKYSAEYSVYLIVRFQLASGKCECSGVKIPHGSL